MKYQVHILGLMTLSLFIFTACTSDVSKQEATPVVTPVVTPAVELETANVLDCNLFEKGEVREMCESQVNEQISNMLLMEARSKFNISLCKNLSTPFSEECERYITDSGVQGPISDEEVLIFKDAVKIILPEPPEPSDNEIEIENEFINRTYKIEKCDELTTPGFKEYCKNKVTQKIDQNTLDSIYTSGDSSKCETIKNDRIKQNCLTLFDIESSEASELSPVSGSL